VYRNTSNDPSSSGNGLKKPASALLTASISSVASSNRKMFEIPVKNMKMKTYLLIVKLSLMLLMMGSDVHAQKGKLPPFRMQTSAGTIFKAENLPMGKPIILIYFDPGCDHCDQLLKAFFSSANEFEKASVAMITYEHPSRLLAFEKAFHTKDHRNLYTGTEGQSFFVRNYYGISSMPFVALYNSMGDLVKEYRVNPSLPDLKTQLAKIN
jgi:hypothetical protein